jgi:hypothetical protein
MEQIKATADNFRGIILARSGERSFHHHRYRRIEPNRPIQGLAEILQQKIQLFRLKRRARIPIE